MGAGVEKLGRGYMYGDSWELVRSGVVSANR
jgi:hypothetical protein